MNIVQFYMQSCQLTRGKSSGIRTSISTSSLTSVATGAHCTNTQRPAFRKSQVWKKSTVRLLRKETETDDPTLPPQWSTAIRRTGQIPPASPSAGIRTCRTSYNRPVPRRSKCSRAQKPAETRSGAPVTHSTRPLAPVSRLTLRACPPYTVPSSTRTTHVRWDHTYVASRSRLCTRSYVCTQPQAGRASMSTLVGAPPHTVRPTIGSFRASRMITNRQTVFERRPVCMCVLRCRGQAGQCE
jgi:hypothetical protein